MAAKKIESEKIGGWLLFFFIIFILAVAGAFYSAIAQLLGPVFFSLIYGQFSGMPTPPFAPLVLRIIAALLFLIEGVFLLLAVIAIAKKQKKAKSLSITGTWMCFASTVYMIILGIILLPQTIAYSQELYADSIASVLVGKAWFFVTSTFSFIFSLAWAIVVMLYFKKSVRVKKTLVK